jgi:hypothetical protein
MLIFGKLAVIACSLIAWFWSQKLIGTRSTSEGEIFDSIHHWTSGLNKKLQDNTRMQNTLLATSSAGIDLLGIFLILAAIFGDSFRPFVGLIMLFGLRQLCQVTTALPIPEGVIWHSPGFPTLLVTYKVANDFFFSGHTAIAVYGAIEIVRILGTAWLPVALVLACYEIVVVLILRAHWTLDVITGIFAAFIIASISPVVAGWFDPLLALLG